MTVYNEIMLISTDAFISHNMHIKYASNGKGRDPDPREGAITLSIVKSAIMNVHTFFPTLLVKKE